MPARKKPAHERKDFYVTLWVTEAQNKAWLARAETEGVTLSAWIRSVLDTWAQVGYEERSTGAVVRRQSARMLEK